VSPGLLIGVLFALIGAQVARLAAPRRLGYPVALALAAAGVVAGELVALGLHTGGPPLGPLHPLADAAGMVILEVAGALVLPAPGARRGRA
jgi:Co/Zn/Cd efflux system component